MTIRSSNPAVQGVLTEQQLRKTEAGQKVKVVLNTEKQKLNGTIAEVATYPDKDPEVHRKSYYPFTVQLEEPAPDIADNADTGLNTEIAPEAEPVSKELNPGTKASLSVITEEALSAPVVAKESTIKKGKKLYMMVLNKNGRIERRPITSGLTVNGRVAVASGTTKGEAYAYLPDKVQRYNTTFITPLDTSKLSKSTLDSLSNKEKWKYTIIGFL